MMNTNTDNLTQIGDRIRRLREKNGLSQSELAKELNVKQQTIDKWEKGERDLKTGYTIALSKYFNVTADYILGLESCTTHEASDIGAITGLSDDNIKALSDITQSAITNKENEKIQILNDFIHGFLVKPCQDGFTNIDNIYMTVKHLCWVLSKVFLHSQERIEYFEKFKAEANIEEINNAFDELEALLMFHDYYSNEMGGFVIESEEYIDFFTIQKLCDNYFDGLQGNYGEMLIDYIRYLDLRELDIFNNINQWVKNQINVRLEQSKEFQNAKDPTITDKEYLQLLQDAKEGEPNGND